MIFRSPQSDIDIPEIPLTPFVLQGAGELGDKPALVEGLSRRTLGYRKLQEMIHRAAAGFIERGLRRGEVVGICAPNVPEYAVVFHGVSLAGGINTPLNPLSAADELAAQLRHTRARYLVTVPPLLDKARQAAEKVGLQCIVIGSAEDHVLLASLLESDPLVSPPEVDARNDTVVLAFSSATTGFAKAVMLTHRNMVANLCQIHSTHHLAAADTIIAVLPFFHIYGMQLLMNLALRSGATVVTMPRFDLEEFLWAIQEHRVTRACLVPPIVVALAKHPLVDAYDLSSLELILCGAAPLSAAVAEACAARLGCPVVQGYGMTEASPVTHLIPDGVPSKPGSVGPSVSRCEWQIVDTESGAGLGIAEVGEICVRGPQVMKGYLNNPVATATAVNPEGWLRTGDIGYADEDGYLFVVDRLEELIKHRGLLIAPSELESQLLAHPAVADAAVVPIPDAEAGEVPKAFVVLKEGSSLDDIVRFVAGRVAPHKRIREVEVVDEIPKSPSGKILRRVLVGRERERRTQENPRI